MFNDYFETIFSNEKEYTDKAYHFLSVLAVTYNPIPKDFLVNTLKKINIPLKDIKKIITKLDKYIINADNNLSLNIELKEWLCDNNNIKFGINTDNARKVLCYTLIQEIPLMENSGLHTIIPKMSNTSGNLEGYMSLYCLKEIPIQLFYYLHKTDILKTLITEKVNIDKNKLESLKLTLSWFAQREISFMMFSNFEKGCNYSICLHWNLLYLFLLNYFDDAISPTKLMQIYKNIVISLVYIGHSSSDRFKKSEILITKILKFGAEFDFDNKELEAINYYSLCGDYFLPSKMEIVLECYDRALKISERILGITSNIAVFCGRHGFVLEGYKKIKEAIVYREKELSIYEKLGEKEEYINSKATHIGRLFLEINNPDKALEYFKKYSNREQFYNLACAYLALNNPEYTKKLLEQAFESYATDEKEADVQQNSEYKLFILNKYVDIGKMFYSLDENDKALIVFEQVLKSPKYFEELDIKLTDLYKYIDKIKQSRKLMNL